MSLPPEYFEALYDAGSDPWSFETRWYEERKRALTMASLPSRHYRAVFEPGCSTGLLSELLAARCDLLVATDVAERAVQAARTRLAGHHQVRVERLSVPAEWPAGGPFDLVVVSEIGYYLDRDGVAALAAATVADLAADGVVVLCHWRHPVADYPLLGDEVHAIFQREAGLPVAVSHLEQDLALLVLTRPGAPSVAAAEGFLGYSEIPGSQISEFAVGVVPSRTAPSRHRRPAAMSRPDSADRPCGSRP